MDYPQRNHPFPLAIRHAHSAMSGMKRLKRQTHLIRFSGDRQEEATVRWLLEAYPTGMRGKMRLPCVGNPAFLTSPGISAI